MDNGSFEMWNNISAPTWQWIKFTTGYNLTEGSHTLTIGYREDGAKLDKLWITRVDAIPDGEGSNAGTCDILSADEAKRPKIEIFPNPVYEILTISLPDSPPADISIYNIDGREVFIQDTNSVKTTINMANYYPGIYFVRISRQGQVVVRKIIKG
jgi:hypothetical protein